MRSPFFKLAFSAEGFAQSGAERAQVAIPLSMDAVGPLLRFLYVGELPGKETLSQHVSELYEASQFMELPVLARHIEEVLMEEVDEGLAVPVAALAVVRGPWWQLRTGAGMRCSRALRYRPHHAPLEGSHLHHSRAPKSS